MTMNIDTEKIVIKVKLTEGKLKAIVALDFGDLVIRGYRIQESNYPNSKGDKLWITAPSYRGGGGYHPMAFMPDKDLWERVQGKIWDSYYKATKKRYTKAYDISEEEADELFK